MSIQNLNSYGNFRIENQKIVFDTGLSGTVKHFFNPNYHTSQVKKVIAFISETLKSAQGDQKKELLQLADIYIARHNSDRSVAKIMQAFDRQLHSFRDQGGYIHPENRSQLDKWIRASQPEEIFHQFPEFAEFLNQSKLLSQMKVTRDTLTLLNGEPAMLVEGHWMKASLVMQKFHLEDSQMYGTKFITDSTGQTYTYLDNGLGFQKYHPYQTIGEIPISVIDDEKMNALRELANKFIRPEEALLSQKERDALNQKRSFVLQLITSYTNRGRSNFAETILNPRHAYLRIVAGEDLPEYKVKKGDVYEFGFGSKRGATLPLEATQGLFCSPDPWEYMSCDKRFVTCVPIDPEAAAAGFEFALRQQRKHVQLGREIGFQLVQQNCTVFDRKVAEQANIAIPTEIELKPLLYRFLPDLLKKLGLNIAAYIKSLSDFSKKTIRAYTPTTLGEWTIRSVEMIHSIYSRTFDALGAFLLLPVRTLLGESFGHGGESFDEGKESIAPRRDLGKWFDLSSYRYNLPIVLQEWQKRQLSTFVVDNPVRLTIVP